MTSKQIIAAFDFDGTITRSDSLRNFILQVAGPRRFVLALLCVSPWLIGMVLGLCDRARTKARFLAMTIGGTRQSDLDQAARDYAAGKLLGLVRPDMLLRVAEHRQRGHRLVLVSASPSLYLKYWAAAAGFDAVLATELEFVDGCFSGRLAASNCWGPEKVRRLQQWFNGNTPQEMYAYGDSRGDREMLALANHAWLRGRDSMQPLR